MSDVGQDRAQPRGAGLGQPGQGVPEDSPVGPQQPIRYLGRPTVVKVVTGYADRRGERRMRLRVDQPPPHAQRQRNPVRRGRRAGGSPSVARHGVDRHEEDVGVRVWGGLSRSGQDGAPGWGIAGQQGVQGALEHVGGQAARDLDGLAPGGRQQVGQGEAAAASQRGLQDQ